MDLIQKMEDWGTILTTILVAATLYGLLNKSSNSRFETLNTALKELKSELKDDIRRINDRVDQLFMALNRSGASAFIVESNPSASGVGIADTAKAQSPTTLTRKGYEMAAKLEARSTIEKYADRVILPEDADNLRIQETCFDFAFNSLLRLVNQQELGAIRQAIYEDGGNAGSVLVIYGILLRDYYFEKRGLPVPNYDYIQEE